jgi:hypothetical protein
MSHGVRLLACLFVGLSVCWPVCLFVCVYRSKTCTSLLPFLIPQTRIWTALLLLSNNQLRNWMYKNYLLENYAGERFHGIHIKLCNSVSSGEDMKRSLPYRTYVGYRNFGTSNVNTYHSSETDQWRIAKNQWRIRTKHRRKLIRRSWLTTIWEMWPFLGFNTSIKGHAAGIAQSV